MNASIIIRAFSKRVEEEGIPFYELTSDMANEEIEKLLKCGELSLEDLNDYINRLKRN